MKVIFVLISFFIILDAGLAEENFLNCTSQKYGGELLFDFSSAKVTFGHIDESGKYRGHSFCKLTESGQMLLCFDNQSKEMVFILDSPNSRVDELTARDSAYGSLIYGKYPEDRFRFSLECFF